MISLYESILKNTGIGYEELVRIKIKEIYEFFEKMRLPDIRVLDIPKKLSDGFPVALIYQATDSIFIIANDRPSEKIFPTYISKLVNKNGGDCGFIFKEIKISDFEYFPRNCKYLRFTDTDIKSFDFITDCFSNRKNKNDWYYGIYFERSFGNVTYKLNKINFEDIPVHIEHSVIDYKTIKGCKFEKLYVGYSVKDDIELMKNTGFNSNPYAAYARHIQDNSATDSAYAGIINNLPGLYELIKNNDIKELVILGEHEKYFDGRLDCIEKIDLDKVKQKRLLDNYRK